MIRGVRSQSETRSEEASARASGERYRGRGDASMLLDRKKGEASER